MRNLTGTYLRENNPIPFSIEIPSEWSELTPHQFAAIIATLSYTKADKTTIAVSLLALLFGRENYQVLYHLMPRPDISDAQLEHDFTDQLVSLTNFLLEPEPPVMNHFPKLKIRKKPCLAPADDLNNLTFGEWCFAFQFYTNYRKTKDMAWIDKLIACLYRPEDPAQDAAASNYRGDQREVFNENLIEKRAKDVGAIELKFKQAVLAWFTIAVNQVMALRPHVFPKVQEQAEEEEEQRLPDPDEHRTWMSVFRELLGPKWGTIEQLKVTNAMFILDALEEQHIAFKQASPSGNS